MKGVELHVRRMRHVLPERDLVFSFTDVFSTEGNPLAGLGDESVDRAWSDGRLHQVALAVGVLQHVLDDRGVAAPAVLLGRRRNADDRVLDARGAAVVLPPLLGALRIVRFAHGGEVDVRVDEDDVVVVLQKAMERLSDIPPSKQGDLLTLLLRFFPTESAGSSGECRADPRNDAGGSGQNYAENTEGSSGRCWTGSRRRDERPLASSADGRSSLRRSCGVGGHG